MVHLISFQFWACLDTKATPKDIKFYKGVMLVKIHDKLTSGGTYVSIEQLDSDLKEYADLKGISCSDMTKEQFQQLKLWSKDFIEHYSIGIDFDYDERLDFDVNRTEK